MQEDEKNKKIPTLNASHVQPKRPDMKQHAGRQNSSQKRNEKSLNIDMEQLNRLTSREINFSLCRNKVFFCYAPKSHLWKD